jgi:hypothetical protein
MDIKKVWYEREKYYDDLNEKLTEEDREHINFFFGDSKEIKHDIGVIFKLIREGIFIEKGQWLDGLGFVSPDLIGLGEKGRNVIERFFQDNTESFKKANIIYNTIATNRKEGVFNYEIKLKFASAPYKFFFRDYFFRYLRTTRLFDEMEIDNENTFVFCYGDSTYTLMFGQCHFLQPLYEMISDTHCLGELHYYVADKNIRAFTNREEALIKRSKILFHK